MENIDDTNIEEELQVEEESTTIDDTVQEETVETFSEDLDKAETEEEVMNLIKDMEKPEEEEPVEEEPTEELDKEAESATDYLNIKDGDIELQLNLADEKERKRIVMLAQQGLNYAGKTTELAKHRSFVQYAEENGITLEDIQQMASAKGGNKEALSNIAKTAKVDVFDLDNDMADDYKPEPIQMPQVADPRIDATANEVESGVKNPIDNNSLLEKFKKIDSAILECRQYFSHTKNPICVITVNKTTSIKSDIENIYRLKEHIKVLVIVDKKNNDIDEPYMLVWRVVNNIDAQRDVILEPFIVVDGTNKGEVDGFNREWPGDTFCTKEVLDSLQKRGLIDIDDAFIKRFGLLAFN